MGPSDDRVNLRATQGRRRPRGPRARRCLLKGCDRWFTPVWPQARYCSEACRRAAARWRRWKAQQRYRQTVRGRACRCAQSRRHRERRRSRPRDQGAASPASRPRVGHHPARNLRAPATGLAATSPSSAAVGLRSSDSVVRPVGAPWNGCSSASTAGTAAGGRTSAAARAAGNCERSILRTPPSARSVDVTQGEGRRPVTPTGVPVASLRSGRDERRHGDGSDRTRTGRRGRALCAVSTPVARDGAVSYTHLTLPTILRV